MVKLHLESTSELGGRRACRRTRRGSGSPGFPKLHPIGPSNRDFLRIGSAEGSARCRWYRLLAPSGSPKSDFAFVCRCN